jgi:phosphoribosylformylglycinamidine synthase
VEFRVRVDVVHRPGILDPQGAQIERSLPALGVDGVSRVSVGKVIRLTIESPDAVAARQHVEDLCEQLLANPVIEDYAVTMEDEGRLA